MSFSTIIEPRQGAALIDANSLINPATDGASDYILPAATLTTNRTLTIGTTGSPKTNTIVRISRLDVTSNTYAVVDGATSATIFTFTNTGVPAGASFYWNGSAWAFLSTYVLDSASLPTLPISIANGGTGQTTAIAGGDALGGTVATIASAGTTDLSTATGHLVIVSGNATITALGSMPTGVCRTVLFSGAPTLTHNAVSLILPGAANVKCAAGDVATFYSLAPGNWRCAYYKQATVAPGANPTSDWFAAMDTLFVSRTGLLPLQWSRAVREEFMQKNAGATVNGLFASGTGSQADIVSGVSIGIGVATLQAPTAGTGEAAWAPTIASGATVATNPRAKRWLLAYRVAVAAAPGANSSVALGGTINNDIFGVGYHGAQANWQYVHGTNATVNITASSQPIDSTGNVLLTVYVANFDLVNVVFNANYTGGAAEIIAEPVSNLPALNWYPSAIAGIGATAPSDKLFLDAAYCAFEI